jgi:hypothetical protein
MARAVRTSTVKQVSVSDVKEEAEGCDIVITRRGRPADVLNDPVEPHRHPHRERGGVANHLGEPLGGLDQPVARTTLLAMPCARRSAAPSRPLQSVR